MIKDSVRHMGKWILPCKLRLAMVMEDTTIGHKLLVGKQENRKIQQHLWQSQIYLSMDEHKHKKCF